MKATKISSQILHFCQELITGTALLVGVTSVTVSPAKAAIFWSIEAPGTQQTTVGNSFTVDFEDASNGNTLMKTFQLGGENLTATYTQPTVVNADLFGGAGGVGQYYNIIQESQAAVELTKDVGYFGMWWSAGDENNVLEFYQDNVLIRSITTADILDAIEASPLSSEYFGNPTTPFLGQVPTEPYAYLNFFSDAADTNFNSIVFKNLGIVSNFESDNHAFALEFVDNVPSENIPEPSTILGLLIFGVFGSTVVKRQS